MKYLDETGLRRFWKKTKEYIEMNGGTGGSGGTSYFEKEYTVSNLEVENPYYYVGAIDTPENSEEDKIMVETLKKYYLLEDGEVVHLFEDNVDSGYYTAKVMTPEQITMLLLALQTFDPTFGLLQASYGVYVSKNDDPFMDMINGNPVGMTVFCLKGEIIFNNSIDPNNPIEVRIPMIMFMYANQMSPNATTMLKFNRIVKIPVKSFLSQEPVLLWEGDDNTYGPIITSDSPSKFRFLSVVYYDDSDPFTLKNVSSIIIDDTATFVINFIDGENNVNHILKFDFELPNRIRFNLANNMSKIHIVKIYGSY